MKIYTKTGDKGTTGLIGGTRVAKNHIRLDAYGTIDELSGFIGLLKTEIEEKETSGFLDFIQQKLFVIGSYLATDTERTDVLPESRIWGNDIALIEQQIDRMDEELPPVNDFILPGGTKSAALSHVCRSVCRRAERCMTSLSEHFSLQDENPFVFINRLSDYFYILARKENQDHSVDEIFWQKVCK
ncbi:MAG: cob(I)yrinic acid a,c-diamide adenosyltransferase [Candidatus Azobacteroides sp.]|nr:cob(I)yrinic acid a,c-diamide adenosyltransferase [Candidatus Azobacteroides sp.]